MRQISLSLPSMLLASFISSSSGAVRRERHEMDEGQRNTMWPEQMEVSRKSGCGRWDVFSFSLSCVSLTLHSSIKTGGEKWMQSLSYSISQHFSPSTSQIRQNAHLTSTETRKKTVIHRRLVELNAPVTPSDILHILCCTKYTVK